VGHAQPLAPLAPTPPLHDALLPDYSTVDSADNGNGLVCADGLGSSCGGGSGAGGSGAGGLRVARVTGGGSSDPSRRHMSSDVIRAFSRSGALK